MANRYKSRYRTSTDSIRQSMCDDACCDLLANRDKNRYRTSTGESNRSMCDDACLCLPNEDFGKRNSALGASFRCTLRGFEYSIWAMNPRKVPRNDTHNALFRFPKSSFGEHKVPSSSRGCEIPPFWFANESPCRSPTTIVASKKLRNFAPTT